ncbi:MAG: hypothetical protein AAGK00_04225 [Pseudomonadota bacterium]
MRLFLPFLAAFLMASSMAMAGPKIWGVAEAGMSPDEIQQLFPEAKTGTRDTAGASGAVELLRLKGHRFQGEPFTVRFFFDQDSLQIVMLSHEEPGTTSTRSILAFTGHFTRLYGSPDYQDSHPLLDASDFTYRRYAWDAPERNVVVAWVQRGDLDPFMNINFTAP